MPELAFKAFQFPSHAVGLEQRLFYEEPLVIINKESPSHPVGLKLISELLECLWDIFKSPSHTVGLEHGHGGIDTQVLLCLHPTQWA